jgi:hypothetical protein
MSKYINKNSNDFVSVFGWNLQSNAAIISMLI